MASGCDIFAVEKVNDPMRATTAQAAFQSGARKKIQAKATNWAVSNAFTARAAQCAEGLGLPRAVLDKFYHGNAQRLIPGIAADPSAVPRADAK